MNSFLEQMLAEKPENVRPKELYTFLNIHCFEGKLPTIKTLNVRWSTAKGHLGLARVNYKFVNAEAHTRFVCDSGSKKERQNRALKRGDIEMLDMSITINRKGVMNHKSHKRMIETMLHEMCHIEQYMNLDFDGHCSSFIQALDKRIAHFNALFGMDICRQWVGRITI